MPYIPSIPNPLADPELARYAFNNSLMSAAEGMLQAGAPSMTPRGGFANALGAGLIGFSRGQKDAVQTALSQRLLQAQMQKLKHEEDAAQARRAAMEGLSPEDRQAVELGGGDAMFAARYRAPPETLADVAAKAAARARGTAEGAAPSDKDNQRASLQARGISADDADDIVNNRLRIQISQADGKVYLIDEVGRQVREMNIQPTQAAQTTTQPGSKGRTLWEAAELGTGPLSAIKEQYGRVAGNLPENVRGKLPVGTMEDRQTLLTEQQELVRSLAVNPRFPVAEIERIRSEIQVAPEFWDSSDAMHSRMRSLDASLRRRLDNANRDAADTSLPGETRRGQAQNASAIRRFLSIMGVPRGEEVEMPRISGDDEYERLPSGATFIGPDGKTRRKP